MFETNIYWNTILGKSILSTELFVSNLNFTFA